jgi:hypothetical protein
MNTRERTGQPTPGFSMDAGRRGITDIFNKARSLEIPFFQRSYVWSRDDWERFADDLIDVGRRRSDYFLGSIILKQRPTPSGGSPGDLRVVVDGQQRLTSLILLFRVLCDGVARDGLFKTVFLTLDGELALRHNHNDVEIFEAIADRGEPGQELRRKYSQNRVLGAYDYFRARQKELDEVDPKALVAHLYFVGIDLGKDEDEQQIFDTINSLGVELTTAELLKNELYERSDLELFNRTWLPAFEKDEERKQYWSRAVTAGRERRQNVDLFLQAYLLNQSGVSDDVRVSSLFSEYRGYLHSDDAPGKSELIRDLTWSANLYRESIDPDLLDEPLGPDDPLHRMNLVVFGLQTTTILPYVLHIMRAVDDPVSRARLLHLTETYVMRRLVCGETPKHYNRFFAGLARNQVDTLDELVRRFTGADEPSVLLPTDEDVREKMPLRNLTNAQARVALYLIESATRDDDAYSTTLAGLRHYTVEHVMPKKWPNRWGPLPEPEARERNNLVRKTGNLTLLSAKLNRTIRDADWETKKKGTGKHSGLLRYGSGIEIFDNQLQKESWSEEDIRARSEWLAELAIQTWPYPGPVGTGAE